MLEKKKTKFKNIM